MHGHNYRPSKPCNAWERTQGAHTSKLEKQPVALRVYSNKVYAVEFVKIVLINDAKVGLCKNTNYVC